MNKNLSLIEILNIALYLSIKKTIKNKITFKLLFFKILKH